MDNVKLNERIIEWQKAQVELIEYLKSTGQDVSDLLEKAEGNLQDTIELGRILSDKMMEVENDG